MTNTARPSRPSSRGDSDKDGRGAGAGGEALTFRRVRERVEDDTGIRVTNASLIGRIRENQVAFQTDVLAALGGHHGTRVIEYTLLASYA